MNVIIIEKTAALSPGLAASPALLPLTRALPLWKTEVTFWACASSALNEAFGLGDP